MRSIVLIPFIISVTIRVVANPELPPPPTEEEARQTIEAHLGVRPETIDMNKVQRGGGRSFFTTVVTLETQPRLIDEGRTCYKDARTLVYPTSAPEEFQKDPAQYRYFKKFVAKLYEPAADCSAIKLWTEVDSSIANAPDVFEFRDYVRNWVTQADVQSDCQKMETVIREFCLDILHAAREEANALELAYIRIYPAAIGSPCHSELEAHVILPSSNRKFGMIVYDWDSEENISHFEVYDFTKLY